MISLSVKIIFVSRSLKREKQQLSFDLFILCFSSVFSNFQLTGASGPRGMTGQKGEAGKSASLPEVTISPETKTVTENQRTLQ